MGGIVGEFFRLQYGSGISVCMADNDYSPIQREGDKYTASLDEIKNEIESTVDRCIQIRKLPMVGVKQPAEYSYATYIEDDLAEPTRAQREFTTLLERYRNEGKDVSKPLPDFDIKGGHYEIKGLRTQENEYLFELALRKVNMIIEVKEREDDFTQHKHELKSAFFSVETSFASLSERVDDYFSMGRFKLFCRQ